MNDINVLHIIQRKTTIPAEGESFNDIEKAYDRAIEIIRQHIHATTHETGFYLEDDPEEALESMPLNDGMPNTGMDLYLHGHCTCFAIALHELFGYDLFFFIDSEDEKSIDNIIHAYCKKNGEYIDVRGITKDKTACFSAFEDFFTDPVVIKTTVEELRKNACKIAGKTTAEKYIGLAREFILSHKDFYEIK